VYLPIIFVNFRHIISRNTSVNCRCCRVFHSTPEETAEWMRVCCICHVLLSVAKCAFLH